MEDRKLDQLIINKLTAKQYQKLIENNEIAEDEIYLVPSIEEELQTDVESLKEQQSSVDTNLSEINQKIQNSTVKIEENLIAISINSQKIGENTAAIEENSSQISQHKGETNQKFSLIDQSLEAQGNEINIIKGDLTSHTNSSNVQFSAVREEVATQDAETLKTAKEYSDANKESAVSSANEYTDQKIDELVNGTGLEGVVDTIKDINEAMAESSDMMEALETANSKKVDKGAKGSTIKPIYFDNNGAQEIAHTIEKSVPSDAKFTDTTYTLIKDGSNIKLVDNSGKVISTVTDNDTNTDTNTTYTLDKDGSNIKLVDNSGKVISTIVDSDTQVTVDSALSTTSTNPVQNKIINSALANKVDKVSGKGLSTNDYTTEEKNKLAGIAAGANAYTLPTATASDLGGVKIGYSQSGKNYPVALDANGRMYVNVPWEDTNTHYNAYNSVGNSDSISNGSTSNGATYFKLVDGGVVRSAISIKGSGGTTVTSDSNGNITINSTDTNTDTKVTNSLGPTVKAYVTGTQDSNNTHTGTQVFDTGVYLDNVAGRLAVTSLKIGEGCNLVYDSTNKCVSFQFI